MADKPPKPLSDLRESARIVLYVMSGELFLLTAIGAVAVFVLPESRLQSPFAHDLLIVPLSLIVGYLVGSQQKNERTPPAGDTVNAEGDQTVNLGEAPQKPSQGPKTGDPEPGSE